MTRLETKLIEQAKLMSPFQFGRCKHTSFCVIRNKIISIGVNSYVKTNPIAFKYNARDSLIHSELAALVNCPRSTNFSKVSVFNVRIKLDGSISLSAPCKSCQKILIAFNIKRCFFTDDYGNFARFF